MSNSNARRLRCLAFAVLLPAAAAAAPRSAVLVVADGLGPAALEYGLARYRQTGSPALPNLEAFFRQSKASLVLTRSTGGAVTDSAAAATAYACGVKTANGYVGMDASGKPLVCLEERVKAAGMALGLVTTTNIWDATPAAFSAHVANRKDREEIRKQQDALQAEQLLGADLKGFFEREKEFRLPSAASYALKALARRPKGFFLLVETERTDEAGHANDLPGLLAALEELDQTLAHLMARRREDPDTTLILVADHETGGLSLPSQAAEPSWATKGHTATPVLLLAAGPEAASLPGVMENTEVFGLLLRSLGLGAS